MGSGAGCALTPACCGVTAPWMCLHPHRRDCCSPCAGCCAQCTCSMLSPGQRGTEQTQPCPPAATRSSLVHPGQKVSGLRSSPLPRKERPSVERGAAGRGSAQHHPDRGSQLSAPQHRVAVTKGFFRHNPAKRRQSSYVSRRQELRL